MEGARRRLIIHGHGNGGMVIFTLRGLNCNFRSREKEGGKVIVNIFERLCPVRAFYLFLFVLAVD